MNKQRREKIAKALAVLEPLIASLDGVDLEDVASEEREAFDNMPEGLQQSEKGQASSDAADTLESANESITSAKDALQEAVDGLQGIE